LTGTSSLTYHPGVVTVGFALIDVGEPIFSADRFPHICRTVTGLWSTGTLSHTAQWCPSTFCLAGVVISLPILSTHFLLLVRAVTTISTAYSTPSPLIRHSSSILRHPGGAPSPSLSIVSGTGCVGVALVLKWEDTAQSSGGETV